MRIRLANSARQGEATVGQPVLVGGGIHIVITIMVSHGMNRVHPDRDGAE